MPLTSILQISLTQVVGSHELSIFDIQIKQIHKLIAKMPVFTITKWQIWVKGRIFDNGRFNKPRVMANSKLSLLCEHSRYNESHGKISFRDGRSYSQTNSISLLMQQPHTEASLPCFHREQLLFSQRLESLNSFS